MNISIPKQIAVLSLATPKIFLDNKKTSRYLLMTPMMGIIVPNSTHPRWNIKIDESYAQQCL